VGEPEIGQRLARVIGHVGRNLSQFSSKIQRSWERAKFENPEDIKHKYQQCLRVCPDFFEHNPRDFEDPFHDMLEAIRQEYRRLTRRKIDSWSSSLRRLQRSAKRRLPHVRSSPRRVSRCNEGPI
jgi:t-SNARE complex subunit (syntaxin)